MAKTKAIEELPPVVAKELHPLAEIFKNMGDNPNAAKLLRGIVRALGFACNEFEKGLVTRALEEYANELDPPKVKPNL